MTEQQLQQGNDIKRELMMCRDILNRLNLGDLGAYTLEFKAIKTKTLHTQYTEVVKDDEIKAFIADKYRKRIAELTEEFKKL